MSTSVADGSSSSSSSNTSNNIARAGPGPHSVVTDRDVPGDTARATNDGGKRNANKGHHTAAPSTDLGDNSLRESYRDTGDGDDDDDNDAMPQLLELDDMLDLPNELEISDTDDQSDYDENLEVALRKTADKSLVANFLENDDDADASEAKPALKRTPETVDDFVRNYLSRKGLERTLNSFQDEWYEMLYRGLLPPEDSTVVADVYAKNQELETSIAKLRQDIDTYKEVASTARATYDKLRKERDFHRMHHKRVVQEKSKLGAELKRLQKYTQEEYEPTIKQLQHRYETVIKERSLLKLERDKLLQRISAMEQGARVDSGKSAGHDAQDLSQAVEAASEPVLPAAQPRKPATEQPANAGAASVRRKVRPSDNGSATITNANANAKPKAALPAKKKGTSGSKASYQQQYVHHDALLPAEDRPNPYLQKQFSPVDIQRYRATHTTRAHDYAVSAAKFHPKKMILATVSDDRKWKMWTFPSGDLLMSGDGHKDWIADCDFHPIGTHLVTASGDCTLKVWDFAQGTATLTLSDHTQAVWSCAFHDTGDLVASTSMDHTAKLWDLTTGRCRQTFRGHSDSVNSVSWRPCTNIMALASGDKTVSVWDARSSALCVANLYGHTNAVNHVAHSAQGDLLASSDADGVVKVWDVRNQHTELLSVDFGPQPINTTVFDPSGQVLASASNDGTCKLFNRQQANARSLTGHDSTVQGCIFDRLHGEYLVTCGADGTFRVWS
ncbi:hypothetical protein RI367_003958 [Sorochytrium milnesiophthora]